MPLRITLKAFKDFVGCWLITTLLCSVAFAQEQTPWQMSGCTPSRTDLPWNMAMGYHFTPFVDGQVTALGGFFNGTKLVRLFETATGTVLASATVSAANTWSYTPINPVSVRPGTTYTVAVYLAGSGASYCHRIRPRMPGRFGGIRNGFPTGLRPWCLHAQKMLRIFWNALLFVPAIRQRTLADCSPKSRPAPFLPALTGGDSWRDFVELR